MKKHGLLISALLGIFSLTSAHAATWRVDSNTGRTADFTSLQQAHDDERVADGDFLYLAGSGVSYGTLNCSKRLSIYGPGYYLAENLGSGYNLSTARVSTVSFNAGSEGSLLASCELESSTNLNTSNITVKRNWVQSVIYVQYNASNIIIAQNYINVTGDAIASTSGDNSDIIIANNYIRNGSGSSSYYTIEMSENDSATISNNILEGQVFVWNSALTNNIHLESSTSYHGIYLNNSTLTHSISGIAEIILPTDATNTTGATNIFIAGGGTTDGRFAINPSGPAAGTGNGGVDMGMFGGANPYVLSGTPPLPSVQLLNAPLFGSQTGGLPVTVRAKTNN